MDLIATSIGSYFFLPHENRIFEIPMKARSVVIYILAEDRIIPNNENKSVVGK